MPLSKIAGTARKPSISARSASSTANVFFFGSAETSVRFREASASTTIMICPFCHAPVKLGGRITCSVVRAASAESAATNRGPAGASGIAGSIRRGDRSGRRIQIAQAHRDRVRTNFPRRARLPTAAKILDVDRAFDSQAGAVILRAFAHVAAQQRRLVFSLGDAAALEQLARRLHRLPSPCIEEELLGNRDSAHGRATSPIGARPPVVRHSRDDLGDDTTYMC